MQDLFDRQSLVIKQIKETIQHGIVQIDLDALENLDLGKEGKKITPQQLLKALSITPIQDPATDQLNFLYEELNKICQEMKDEYFKAISIPEK